MYGKLSGQSCLPLSRTLWLSGQVPHAARIQVEGESSEGQSSKDEGLQKLGSERCWRLMALSMVAASWRRSTASRHASPCSGRCFERATEAGRQLTVQHR